MANKSFDVAIIGGGLSGLLAAIRLLRDGKQVVLIDKSLSLTRGSLGGFASFSGAKFSLPPAGLGLVPLVGSLDVLDRKVEEILHELEIHNSQPIVSRDETRGDESIEGETVLRKYESIVLSPYEITRLLERLSLKISGRCRVVNGTANKLTPRFGGWSISVDSEIKDDADILFADAVFYAAGRLSSDILKRAGAEVKSGKGLDVGVRVEFLDKSALDGLRALGPDAKIINGTCRTFCLNSPGLIYRYPLDGVSIPGGIVADSSEARGNVGLLVRVGEKAKQLQSILSAAKNSRNEMTSLAGELFNSVPFEARRQIVSEILGSSTTAKLESFCRHLDHLKLIDWSSPHHIHLPLIDWHWDTFAETASHRTSLRNVYALGDSSGHARGLLQASLSGWIAAEEYLNAEAK